MSASTPRQLRKRRRFGCHARQHDATLTSSSSSSSQVNHDPRDPDPTRTNPTITRLSLGRFRWFSTQIDGRSSSGHNGPIVRPPCTHFTSGPIPPSFHGSSSFQARSSGFFPARLTSKAVESRRFHTAGACLLSRRSEVATSFHFSDGDFRRREQAREAGVLNPPGRPTHEFCTSKPSLNSSLYILLTAKIGEGPKENFSSVLRNKSGYNARQKVSCHSAWGLITASRISIEAFSLSRY